MSAPPHPTSNKEKGAHLEIIISFISNALASSTILGEIATQLTFTCSISTIEALLLVFLLLT